MPLANKKNIHLDGTAKSRGYWSGKDVTWTGEDANAHIEKWMRDMGMIVADADIPKSGLISECLVVGGAIGPDFVLAKNRDRKYVPVISVVRKLSKRGIEMVMMYDKKSQYVEGMNEFGIGVLNTTLLNEDDSAELSGYNRRQGDAIHRALCCRTLDKALRILTSHNGGIDGHTIVSDPLRMFHIELCTGGQAHVNRLDPSTGFNVHTNHGKFHPDAGYRPKDGSNYVSSKMRKAMAEVELMGCEDEKEIMKCLRQQMFDSDSNYNMHRRVPGESGMFTTSQVCMNLSALTFHFHTYDNFCDFHELEEFVPEDYVPKIKVKMSNSSN